MLKNKVDRKNFYYIKKRAGYRPIYKGCAKRKGWYRRSIRRDICKGSTERSPGNNLTENQWRRERRNRYLESWKGLG
jgi:hypothetical protein